MVGMDFYRMPSNIRMGQSCGLAGITHLREETTNLSRPDLWALWEIPLEQEAGNGSG